MRNIIAAAIVALGLVGYSYFSPAQPNAHSLDKAIEVTYNQNQEDLKRQEEQIAALIDCMRNNAYTVNLKGQCIDDWFEQYATTDY